jgi:hypothetical protein
MPPRELLAGQLAMTERRDEVLTVLKEELKIIPDYTPLRKHGARLLLESGDSELHRLLARVYEQFDEPVLATQIYRNLLVNGGLNREEAAWVRAESGGSWLRFSSVR